jgi:hypothetical protein
MSATPAPRITATMRAALDTIAADPSAPGVSGATLDRLNMRGLVRCVQPRDANGYALTFPRWYLTHAAQVARSSGVRPAVNESTTDGAL